MQRAENLSPTDMPGKYTPSIRNDTLFGRRCYPHIHDIKDDIDLAIIIIPSFCARGSLMPVPKVSKLPSLSPPVQRASPERH
jgi:hypothetical protein